MAAEGGPKPEDVEEGRKAAFASGLLVVRYVIEDLAEKYQRLEDRPAFAARARALEPLLSEKLVLDFNVPVLVDPDAPSDEKLFTSRHVFINFARVDADYDIVSEQNKLLALCSGFDDEQLATVKKDLRGKMSLLIYNTRAAFRTFALSGDATKTFLCDLMGSDVDNETRERVLAGAFVVDPEEMTLRVVDTRYGIVVGIDAP
jgi:uncharacterized protein YlaI